MRTGKNKVSIIVILSLFILSISAFFYIHFLKAKTPKPTAKSESPIDITPLIVSKLQQLVKQGSDSLYDLSIEVLKPDVIASQVDIIKAKLVPDSAVLQQLNKEKKAPDDVFTISFSALHVTGVGIADFLHKKDIRLDTVFISSPLIEVSHTERPYNAAERAKDSKLTLYQKLTKQCKSISIAAIVVKEGTFITTNLTQKKQTTRFNKVDINIGNVLIDSSTQFDKDRFLFSKTAALSCKDYISYTPDSFYIFKVGSFSVVAEKHSVTAKQVSFLPRGNKEQFQKKLKTRDDMFTVNFPEIECTDIDWWALINKQRFYADEISLTNGSFSDYLNRTLPSSGTPGRKDNFPQQLLLQTKIPINVRRLQTNHTKISYEEYSPEAKKAGTLTFDNLDATINNITNIKEEIQKNTNAACSATCLLMNKVPVEAHFNFDLSKRKTGNFSADLHVATTPNSVLNPVAEPMGMFTIQSGTVKSAAIHISGDDFKAQTNILMLYNDLTLYQLKNTDGKGDLKKKSLAGFFANTFIIKNANPTGNKEPRKIEAEVQRDDSGSFFNFLWKAVLTGIVKTIGLPKKIADK